MKTLSNCTPKRSIFQNETITIQGYKPSENYFAIEPSQPKQPIYSCIWSKMIKKCFAFGNEDDAIQRGSSMPCVDLSSSLFIILPWIQV